jgi:prepilin-type N-terminal cleavage/methylation domain-containing protein
VPAPVPARTDAGAGGDDHGFTMIEVVVSLAVIGLVMAAVTSFFTATLGATNQQRGKQVAAQLADDGAEQVRALTGSSLAIGRARGPAEPEQIVAGVNPYLSDLEQWNDPAAVGTPVLPLSPAIVTVNGIGYRQHWYLGRCWLPTNGTICGAVKVPGFVEFFRAVIAVTWPDKHCTAGTCSFVTATLVSSGTDEPLFNSNETAVPPAVENPGAQVSDVNTAVSVSFRATGGAPPLVWSATGLPPGLTIASDTGTVSGTPTTIGTYPVVIRATDLRGMVGTAGLTWTVNPLPVLAAPANRSTPAGSAVSLAVARTGGTDPVAWTATGLPAGVTINATTGAIAGTPTTVRAATAVTVTVTDRFARSATATFQWAVVGALTVNQPTAQSTKVNSAVGTVHINPTGGTQPYTYSITGTPPGVAIDATGKIQGKPTVVGTYPNVIVTVTDAAGFQKSTARFTWTVTT